ncbi:MAG TPA: wax ester/triacylglycerol synthase family O-acyltransferase [Anaeromyxobacteraceae bacterium]|nr:wax ester/triacylglycerol synthase family O-acyltransferase [Anaeromyxobacteraceae bacterium]
MTASEPVASVDAAWLKMDRPRNTADIVGLLTFRDPLPPETVRDLVEQQLLRYDRFRQRVVHSGVLREPTWEDDPAFSLDRHVVATKLPGGNGALERLVASIATDRLDPEHPLWQMHVVDLGEDGSALVTKIHHCIGDGFALVGVLLSIADELTEGAIPPAKRVPTLPAIDLFKDPLKTIRDAVLDPMRAVKLGKNAVGLALAIARMSILPSDPSTALNRPLSGRRKLVWSRGISMDQLRAGCHQLGATANEVLIAALAGALGAHLAAGGDRVDKSLRAMVPVNLRDMIPVRAKGAEALGNRFGLVFVDLPVHMRGAQERLYSIRAQMTALKKSPDPVATFGVLSALGLVPKLLEQIVIEFFTTKASLVVTNVPGPRESLHLAGKQIEHLMFCVPHPARLGLGVSILSYAGEVRIGVRADEAVMSNPQDLVDRFHAELQQLVKV